MAGITFFGATHDLLWDPQITFSGATDDIFGGHLCPIWRKCPPYEPDWRVVYFTLFQSLPKVTENNTGQFFASTRSPFMEPPSEPDCFFSIGEGPYKGLKEPYKGLKGPYKAL